MCLGGALWLWTVAFSSFFNFFFLKRQFKNYSVVCFQFESRRAFTVWPQFRHTHAHTQALTRKKRSRLKSINRTPNSTENWLNAFAHTHEHFKTSRMYVEFVHVTSFDVQGRLKTHTHFAIIISIAAHRFTSFFQCFRFALRFWQRVRSLTSYT